MAELVIKVDEKLVEWIDEYYDSIRMLNGKKIGIIIEAIKNGVLLPKGHGRLKDEDEIIECIENRVKNLMKDKQFLKYRKDIDVLGTIPHIRHEVKTIIEAYEEGKNEN